MTYYDELKNLADAIPTALIPFDTPRVKRRRPTQAFSDFVTHREQGDWAETIVHNSFMSMIGNEYDIHKYGKTDDILASDPGFKTFYDNYQQELERIGKRPDLLVSALNTIPIKYHNDISKIDDDALLLKYASSAIFGMEVRSSAYLVKQYINNNRSKSLSFTSKIEDLQVILQWIKVHNIPHYYVQVFFDEVHIISFQKILEILSDPTNYKKFYTIQKNTRNQLKTTIHINIDQGIKLGTIDTLPVHESKSKELSTGRILHYVVFTRGELTLFKNIVMRIIDDAKNLKSLQ